jgi:hypothetical protein
MPTQWVLLTSHNARVSSDSDKSRPFSLWNVGDF